MGLSLYFYQKPCGKTIEYVNDVILTGAFSRSSPPGSTLPLLGGLAMMAEKPMAVMSFKRIAAGPLPLVGATTTTGTRLKGCVKLTLIHLAVRTGNSWTSKVGSTSGNQLALRRKVSSVTVIRYTLNRQYHVAVSELKAHHETPKIHRCRPID